LRPLIDRGDNTGVTGRVSGYAVLSLLLLLLALAPVWPAAVTAAAVALDLQVPALQWKATRLRNLPAGALVLVKVEASAGLDVAFVDNIGFRRLPALDHALFHARDDAQVSFSITIPTTGDYYVVLDNRTASEPRTVRLNVNATSGGRRGSAEVTLTHFEDSLKRLFVFEPFPIRVKRCGMPQAFAGPSGIILCAEYAERLAQVLGDQAKTADAILFTLFHELGHVLLGQWKYPVFDNEEVADEFATVVMVMVGQGARARAKAEFFAKNASVAEALTKQFRDDRHPVSAQRARNILRWLDDSNLVRKWQPLLVPHMQTTVLRRLLASPPTWADRELIEKTLSTRG
jgi:Putative metallopeptidase